MALPLNHETVEETPKAASTVMVLRDGATGLEVLLVRRHAYSPVLAGAHVFPGGKVDPKDLLFPSERLRRTDAQLQRELAEPGLSPTMARGIWVTAFRETFEECGLLLGLDRPEHSMNGRMDWSLNRSWEQTMHGQSWPLQTDSLIPWTRWITPKRPSVSNKRFDTRIFLTICPGDQRAQADGHEMTEVIWTQPRLAIQRYGEGLMDLAPVQLICLIYLLNFSNAAQAIQDASKRPPRLIEPLPCEINGQRVICYPGDPLHAISTPAWQGSTRLVHRFNRFEPVAGLASLLSRL